MTSHSIYVSAEYHISAHPPSPHCSQPPSQPPMPHKLQFTTLQTPAAGLHSQRGWTDGAEGCSLTCDLFSFSHHVESLIFLHENMSIFTVTDKTVQLFFFTSVTCGDILISVRFMLILNILQSRICACTDYSIVRTFALLHVNQSINQNTFL